MFAQRHSVELSNMLTGQKARQSGITLTELLIAVVIALFVLSGVVTLFTNSLRGNTDALKMTRLNQELRAVMDLMVRDIRRAGYWGNAASGIGAGASYSNPFAAINTATAGCILYSYDSNGNGTLDTSGTDERYGFRLSNSAVEMRQGGGNCGASGWQDITDPNVTEITVLTFTPTTRNIEIDDEVGSAEGDLTIREITITLTGRVVNDTAVTRTLTETIRVRNDLFTPET